MKIYRKDNVDTIMNDSDAQKQSAQYARSLIEASLDPLVTISADGKITDVNEASIKVTGVPREKLIGTNFSNYFTEPEKAQEGYRQVFEKSFVSDYPLTIKHKNGQLTDVLYNASVYKDIKGNVLGVFAAARDVTDQKQTAQYARSLIEASLDPLVTISADGKITDVNEASIKATGVPREQLIGTDFSNYFTEPQKAQEGYQQVFEKSFVSDYPLTIKHKNGSLTDVLYNASVYKDDKGNVLGVFAAARDVTEQKWAKDLKIANKELAFQNQLKEKRAAELVLANQELAFQNDEKEKRAVELGISNQELNLSERLLKESLKEVSDYKDALDEIAIIALTDQKGIIKKANSNFCKISKYSEEELIGQDHRILNSGYHTKEFMRDMWTTIANRKIWKGEVKNKAKDGTFYWVDTTIVPFLNEQGKPYQYLAIRVDITKRKKSEEQLVAANKELAFEIQVKVKRAAELIIANEELAFQNDEKEKRAAELFIANEELIFLTGEKEKRAAELVIAEIELDFQNKEKEKREVANRELERFRKLTVGRELKMIELKKEIEELKSKI